MNKVLELRIVSGSDVGARASRNPRDEITSNT